MKAIIFDFFGVIHDDPLKLWLPNVGQDAHVQVATAARDLDTGAIGFGGFLERLAKASGQAVEAILDVFSDASVNHDTVRLLNDLQGRIKLCLLSNAHCDELLPLMDKHDLRRYFDELVISSETGMAKPDAGIFAHALERLGLEANDVIFIDDNLHNVEAAERLGIRSIHFKDAEDLEEQLACVES